MILAATIGIAALVVVIAVYMLAVGISRSAWGRDFDRQLRGYVEGSEWLPGNGVCEALHAELIQRSDRMAASRRLVAVHDQ